MLVQATPRQAAAIVRAMKCVATGDGADTLTAAATAIEPEALHEAITCPHDSTHLLSDYSTSPQGELLVSTFTAGMHPPSRWPGTPVIFSRHLGIELNPVAGTGRGALHPGKFSVAWERGTETMGDPFGASWELLSMRRPTTGPTDSSRSSDGLSKGMR